MHRLVFSRKNIFSALGWLFFLTNICFFSYWKLPTPQILPYVCQTHDMVNNSFYPFQMLMNVPLITVDAARSVSTSQDPLNASANLVLPLVWMEKRAQVCSMNRERGRGGSLTRKDGDKAVFTDSGMWPGLAISFLHFANSFGIILYLLTHIMTF